jgi:hypothetical protein
MQFYLSIEVPAHQFHIPCPLPIMTRVIPVPELTIDDHIYTREQGGLCSSGLVSDSDRVSLRIPRTRIYHRGLAFPVVAQTTSDFNYWSLVQAIFPCELLGVPSSIERIRRGCSSPTVHFMTFDHASNLRIIENGAFSYCRSLRSICIPASVLVLESEVFSGCEGLSSVTFEPRANLQRISSSAFDHARQFPMRL